MSIDHIAITALAIIMLAVLAVYWVWLRPERRRSEQSKTEKDI